MSEQNLPGAKSLTSESQRTYVWADGATVVIEDPIMLWVSARGHRIVDKAGNGHYIPSGWIHLHWKTNPGFPPMMF